MNFIKMLMLSMALMVPTYSKTFNVTILCADSGTTTPAAGVYVADSGVAFDIAGTCTGGYDNLGWEKQRGKGAFNAGATTYRADSTSVIKFWTRQKLTTANIVQQLPSGWTKYRKIITSTTAKTQRVVIDRDTVTTIDTSMGLTPSYLNPDGSGDRRSRITISSTLTYTGALSNLVDGGITDNFWWNNSQTVAGAEIEFVFLDSAKITEVVYFQGGAISQGTWRFQGSNDGGATWTTLGNDTILGAMSTQDTIKTMYANTGFYTSYRFFGVSGTTSSSQYAREFQFKVCGEADTTFPSANALLGARPALEDIRFTTQTGQMLPYFVVPSSAATTLCTAFVELKTSSVIGDTFRMYYGNATCRDYKEPDRVGIFCQQFKNRFDVLPSSQKDIILDNTDSSYSAYTNAIFFEDTLYMGYGGTTKELSHGYDSTGWYRVKKYVKSGDSVVFTGDSFTIDIPCNDGRGGQFEVFRKNGIKYFWLIHDIQACPGGPDAPWDVCSMYSTDGGATFSTPVKLIDNALFFGRIIVHSSGTVMGIATRGISKLISYRNHNFPDGPWIIDTVFRSNDTLKLNETSIIELPDHRILATCRGVDGPTYGQYMMIANHPDSAFSWPFKIPFYEQTYGTIPYCESDNPMSSCMYYDSLRLRNRLFVFHGEWGLIAEECINMAHPELQSSWIHLPPPQSRNFGVVRPYPFACDIGGKMVVTTSTNGHMPDVSMCWATYYTGNYRSFITAYGSAHRFSVADTSYIVAEVATNPPMAYGTDLFSGYTTPLSISYDFNGYYGYSRFVAVADTYAVGATNNGAGIWTTAENLVQATTGGDAYGAVFTTADNVWHKVKHYWTPDSISIFIDNVLALKKLSSDGNGITNVPLMFRPIATGQGSIPGAHCSIKNIIVLPLNAYGALPTIGDEIVIPTHYYIKSTGTNIFPFSDSITATTSLSSLFDSLTVHSIVIGTGDTVSVMGTVIEPHSPIGGYDFGGALFKGRSSKIDKVVLDSAIINNAVISKLHLTMRKGQIVSCKRIDKCKIGYINNGAAGLVTTPISWLISEDNKDFRITNNVFYATKKTGDLVYIDLSKLSWITATDSIMFEHNTVDGFNSIDMDLGSSHTVNYFGIRNNIFKGAAITVDLSHAIVAVFQHTYNSFWPTMPTYILP
jgi:hypothetical protein